MTIINFISETSIRANTVFNLNVDIKDLVNNIPVAQDMYLEPILGTDFYDALQLTYSAHTLNADETDLMNHIKPMLAYKTASISLPFIYASIKNKGPQLQNGDNSTSVDSSTHFYLKKEIENRAEWYTVRLQRFLTNNGNKFPLYVSQSTDTDLYPDKTQGYDSGFGRYDGCNYTPNSFCNGFNGFWRTNIY
jgi:hypothetical protein